MAGPRPRYPFAIVAGARNELDHIVEWLDYHRSIGFDHVFLTAGDDDPAALAALLDPYTSGSDPFVTLTWSPFVPGRSLTETQREMFLDTLRAHGREIGWLSFLDVDEFVTLPGRHDVAAFVAEHGADADSIYLNWVSHSHGVRPARDGDSVLLAGCHRARLVDYLTKQIVRADRIDPERLAAESAGGAPAFHHGLDPYGLDCRNVLGEPMAGYSVNASGMLDKEAATPAMLRRGYVAHFAVKSIADFTRRIERRDAGSEMWEFVLATGRHRDFMAANGAVFDDTLSRYWFDHAYRAAAAAADPGNIALPRPSWQSSTRLSLEGAPPGSHLIGHGNDGVTTGGFGFCTERERDPWWTLDLLDRHAIDRMVVFNRLDDPAAAVEAAGLEIWLSSDLADWRRAHARDPALGPFGGIDGLPLEVVLDGAAARFVRIARPGEGMLHLDEIRVEGRPIPR